MTYTKQVREYCENNKGIIIDVSKVKEEEFAELPYKTLLKILNRLEEEKIVAIVLSIVIISVFSACDNEIQKNTRRVLMKYCIKCKKKFDTKDELCPNCGGKLCEMSQDVSDEINDNEAAEIVSTMMMADIL